MKLSERKRFPSGKGDYTQRIRFVLIIPIDSSNPPNCLRPYPPLLLASAEVALRIVVVINWPLYVEYNCNRWNTGL
jgi:hypothetical protein